MTTTSHLGDPAAEIRGALLSARTPALGARPAAGEAPTDAP
ncbi:hypothetical protein [Sphaerisporangium album]|nr:hypothetical protein [Sphaerisporangium album]